MSRLIRDRDGVPRVCCGRDRVVRVCDLGLSPQCIICERRNSVRWVRSAAIWVGNCCHAPKRIVSRVHVIDALRVRIRLSLAHPAQAVEDRSCYKICSRSERLRGGDFERKGIAVTTFIWIVRIANACTAAIGIGGGYRTVKKAIAEYRGLAV